MGTRRTRDNDCKIDSFLTRSRRVSDSTMASYVYVGLGGLNCKDRSSPTMLNSFATPAASAPCDMASKLLSGALPSVVGSFTAKAGNLYGPRCKQLNRLLGVRAMSNAASSDIPVNRSGSSGSGGGATATSGPGVSTAGGTGGGGSAGDSRGQLESRQDQAPARRGGRGRRSGDLLPFGGGLLGDIWDPFTAGNPNLRQMLDVVDRIFDDSLLFPFGRTGSTSPARGIRTPWDVVETENEFHLRFDLPGFSKDEVKVSMEDRNLIIQAEKKEGQGDDKFGDRSRATFYTRVELPENVKSDEIKAQLKHGVLEINVPKTKHEPKRKEIDVQVDDQ